LLPYFWWTTIFTIYTEFWQGVHGWRAIDAALHFVPIGVVAFAASWTGALSRLVSPKWIILSGQGLMVVATVLVALASSPGAYWPLVFPAFVLGSTGAMLSYTHTNIAIFRAAPARMAGTVGAIYNGALQLGSAVGIAAASSVESSVERRSPRGFEGYEGRAAAFWFLLGVVSLEALSVLVFYRREGRPVEDEETRVKSVESDRDVLPKEKEVELAQGVDLPDLRA
jgi:MFS family permease